MKYEFIDVNNFIVAQASAEHYEADFKIFRKLFPESRLLKDLENPFPPQKKELDERMLYEILNADRICFETILENRGIVVTPKQDDLPGDDISKFVNQLLHSDIETLKYNELKALVFGLKLEVPNQKADTLKDALVQFMSSLKQAASESEGTKEETNNADDQTNATTASDAQGSDVPGTEKKS